MFRAICDSDDEDEDWYDDGVGAMTSDADAGAEVDAATVCAVVVVDPADVVVGCGV